MLEELKGMSVISLTLILVAIYKKDINRGYQVHIDFYFFEERGDREWTHMFRCYFYELIWSVYL
jgi:hypothetical protein